MLFSIVLWIACCKLAGPIECPTHGAHLRFHHLNIAIRPLFWMTTRCHGGIFSGHTKSIPTHRVQDIMPGIHFVPSYNVSHCIISNVSHVKPAGGIGKHFQHIIFWFFRICFCLKDFCIFPGFLPLFLNRLWVILRHLECPI